MAEQVTVVAPDGSSHSMSRKAFELVFRGKGYAIAGEVIEPLVGTIDISKLTRDELEDFAVRETKLVGDELGQYKTKADLIAAIEAASGSVDGGTDNYQGGETD